MVPAENFDSRINLVLVAFLTYAAFKMSIASMLPKVGYLSLLDKYIMAAFLITFASGVESIALYYSIAMVADVDQRMDAESAKRIDSTFMLITSVVWGMTNAACMLAASVRRTGVPKDPKRHAINQAYQKWPKKWNNMQSTLLTEEEGTLAYQKAKGKSPGAETSIQPRNSGKKTIL